MVEENGELTVLLRTKLQEALPAGLELPDDAVVDYLVSMLLEKEEEGEEYGSASSASTSTSTHLYLYDDETVRGMLEQQLPPSDDLADRLAASDIAALRSRLEATAASAKRRAEERERGERRRRALSASGSASVSNSVSNSQAAFGELANKDAEDEEEEDEEAETARERSGSIALHAARHGEALAFLEQLAPDVPPAVVKYVFDIKCLHQKERAAELLIEAAASPDEVAALKAEKEEYDRTLAEAQEEAREAERQAQAAVRKAIVDRFADEVVIHGQASTASSSLSNGKKKAGIAIPAPPPETNVRYRDNQPVHMKKGEKYIVEKLTPDWDGGSRGKVKTKGKRGPGFV